MITFVVPTFKNPKGLSMVLEALDKAWGADASAIVLFDKHDPFLFFSKNFLETLSKSLSLSNLDYIVYETPSYTAKVNLSMPLVKTPFVCLLNDDIILTFKNSDSKQAVLDALHSSCDGILSLYFCLDEETDYSYAFPVISKRFVELTGYFLHPICGGQEIGERWIGSVFDRLNRMVFVKGIELFKNTEFPSQVLISEEAKVEAEYLYTCTKKVRTETVHMLAQFIIE